MRKSLPILYHGPRKRSTFEERRAGKKLFRPAFALRRCGDVPGRYVSSRRMLMELMLEARGRGAAVLWISHDLAEDAPHADAVLTLEARSLTKSEGGVLC